MRNDPADKLLELYDKMDVAIMVLDARTGKLLYVNQCVCRDMGLTREETFGQPYRQVFWKEFHPVYEKLVLACEDGATHTDIFHWTSRAIWEQISARRIKWQPGRPAILLTITNVTEVSRALYELKQAAYYDPLLHLPNRLSLKEDIDALRSVDGVGIIRFDLRHLSGVNDLYGWEVGDLLLRRISDWLLQTSSTSTKVYHLFEAGFCLMVRDITQEELENRANRIVDRFRRPWRLPVNGCDVPVYISVTMGVIRGEDIAGEAQNLIFHTLGKQTPGNDGHIKCDLNYLARLQSRMRLRQDLISSVRRGMAGFSVYYQPIVEIETGRWAGVEALCRWETPEAGMILPSLFIKEAEQMGLIAAIDDWVCRTAINDCWNIGLHEKDFHLDINMSLSRKYDDSFIRNLVSFTEEIRYPKDKLTIEITESTKIDFNEETLSVIHRLKEHGFFLALDDFGTGYSSFESLLRIPADTIKTDRSMVENINEDASKQFLMKMLVDLARFTGMYFFVEGVETEEQKKLLRGLGIKYIQGYLYSKPFPVEALRENAHRFD